MGQGPPAGMNPQQPRPNGPLSGPGGPNTGNLFGNGGGNPLGAPGVKPNN